MRRTLNLLRKESLVNRLPYLEPDKERGGITFVSGLSDKGVKTVEFDYLASLSAKTFDEHSQRTLDHELEIAFFHIALKAFCKRNVFNLYWQQKDLKCAVNPDAYFAITDPSRPEGKNTLHYFLEIERAKFGHYRNGEPQIMKKLGSYYDYFNTDKCEREWAHFRQFRVIIVQPSEHRREFLLSKLAEKYNHRMFWLTTEELYRKNIYGTIFANPKDGTSKLSSLHPM